MPEQRDRLRSIDPDALALEVGRALVDHYARAALPLGPGLQLQVDGGVTFDGDRPRRLPADPRSVGVATTAADLCHFAQSGVTGDWGGPAGAIDAAQSIVEALYAAPADRLAGEEDGEDPTWMDRIEGASDLAVVLRAALARAWIETGIEDPPATWLADLAGLSRSALAAPIAEGELPQRVEARGRARVAYIDRAYARAWLVRRGILAEVEAPKKNRRGQ